MRIKKLFLLLTALLAAVLLLGAPTAQAAESSDSGSAGDTVTWTLDNKGVLTISGTGEMTSRPWLEDYAKVIKQVVIEEGVTSVYTYAFSGCSSLTSVSLPDSLTEICDFAFENCSSLESIVIPEGVTQLRWHTFGWCSSLKNVTLPVSLTKFSVDPFTGCSNIENVYISDLYAWCSLDFTDAGLFYDHLYVNGEEVTNLVIPEGITSISEYAFDNWTALESVTVPSTVTSIGEYAFRGCENLKEVNLSDGITALHSYIFSNCPSLTSLTLPASLLVVDSNIFYYSTYNYVSAITELTFLGDAPSFASNAFNGVTATVTYSANNPTWTEDVLQNYGGTITWNADASIPGTGNVDTVFTVDSGTCGDSVNWKLDNLGRLIVSGSGEMTSRPWLEDYAKVIKQVIIEEGVTSVYTYAFSGCSSLTGVSLPDSLTEICDFAFENCSSLESIVIPEGVTQLRWHTFGWCSSLKNVTLPVSLTKFSVDPFTGCSNIENVYISDLYTWCSLDFTDAGLFYDHLYVNGEEVTNLVIPEGITSISEYAFDNWTALESVTVPSTVTSIGEYAFRGCENLKEVNLSNGITALHSYVFSNCTSLTSLTLPASLLVVDSNIFYYSTYNYVSAITELTFLGDAPLIASDAFKGVTATVRYSAENASWKEEKRLDYGGTITWVPDSTIPTTGATGETVTVDSGTCGDALTWNLNSDGLLTISGTGEMTSRPWLEDYAKVIKQVIIEEGATSVYTYAFSGCSSLTSVSLPDSLTEICDFAFENCSSLESIVIPEGVTQLRWHTFGWCSSLKNVTLPVSLTKFSVDPFTGCSNIENVYISDLYTWCSLDFTDAGLFYDHLYVNDEEVTNLVIPEGITSISEYAFDNWTALESVTIPSTVTSIGEYAFRGCENLKEVNLSNGITALHSYVFSNCPSLTSLTLPASLLVVDSNIFYYSTYNYVSAITELTFLGDAPLIASDAFKGVTATVRYSAHNDTWTEDVLQNYGGSLSWLADASIPGTGTGSGVYIIASGTCGSNVHWTLDSNGKLVVSGGMARSADGFDMDDYASAEETPWYPYRDQIQQVVVESTVNSIGDNAFAQCENLAEVTVQEGVSDVGAGAFAECGSLNEVTFQGNAPTFGDDCFSDVTATVKYPIDDSTWTEDTLQNAGGTVTMVPYVPDPEVLRIAGADRIATSLMLADQLKETLGVETFDSIIVASALNFPDALTGSYLAAVKSAPILLTYPAAHEQTCAYIETTLTSGGTVYILGGTGAVSADFENLLIAKGIPSKRVAGSDRFGTNLAILAEAGISAGQPILIATATGFADSLSASATGMPMLLVYGKLTDEQKEFLETTSKKFIIIGGDAAVSAALEAELAAIGDVERVAGESRYQTSVKVAEKFIQAPDAAILAYARNFPDGLCGGPLAYALGAPLILTDNVDPSAADAYVEGLKSGIVVGGGGLISDASAREIFDLAADAEISVK